MVNINHGVKIYCSAGIGYCALKYFDDVISFKMRNIEMDLKPPGRLIKSYNDLQLTYFSTNFPFGQASKINFSFIHPFHSN